ncbi:MAG: hypothetical protein DWQ37_18500 [Planctomycetota bacterium]|nr:MAG: hypothetical protein DWQ37_18500 [Planctomycetota bacterium]
MATQVKQSPKLEPVLEAVLGRLRRRVRAYLLADGVAAVLVLLGAAFWLSLAFDWVFEPPRPLRAVLLVVVAAALIYVTYRYLIARLAVRLRNRNMAVLLERRFGEFRDSLLTAVELSESPRHANEFNSDMLAHARREALLYASQVELGRVFNPGPLVRRASLAAALAGAVVVFAVAAPEAVGIWARRSLLLGNELWPRRTHLSVEGFDDEGHVKIARGADWDLLVKADAAPGREIPEVVEVRYSTAEGSRGRDNMSREGIVSPGEAAFQPYAYTFKSVLAPLEFYIAGGDARQGPFFLDVVDSPTIAMTLHCEYPPYTRRAPRDIPVAGLMQVPMGTQVTILAEANKPLVAVQIDDAADENAPLAHRLNLAAEHGAPQRSFEFSLPRLEGDKTLLFTLSDVDGIRSREPVRLTLAAVPDEAPEVDVALKGIGTAITPEARLPAAGEVTDDYGVARVWFEYQVDDSEPAARPLELAAQNQEQVAVAGAMDVEPLELKPTQKLHWSVRAADGCALPSGPNEGTGQRYVLDVVTAETLRSMLEARELMLRRRFETIITELTDTRDMLASVEFETASETADESEAKDATSDEADAPARRPSQAIQVERVRQNCQRSGHETMQVAIAFDGIREEMINNRIDTEELKTRLKEGIADPLKAIAEDRFPPLVEKLKQLSEQLADSQTAAATGAEAVGQIDGILVEMQGVLDKMMELETFNEVLDTLRKIIEDQEKVNEETKQKRKSGLRDLIE